MKLFKFTLSTLVTFFLFIAPSAYAAYGVEDVANDTSEKTTNYGTEVEVNEFVLLDAMPDIELYYYPYSATDADAANSEDVPGGAGSVFVGGGIIKWHSNIDTTISIDDFTLTNIDSSVTERNEIAANNLGIWINPVSVGGAYNATDVANLTFDGSYGATVAEMGTDMTTAYGIKATAQSSFDMPSPAGNTDFATKFYIAVTLASAGSVQGAGTYRATATVRALPTVSS